MSNFIGVDSKNSEIKQISSALARVLLVSLLASYGTGYAAESTDAAANDNNAVASEKARDTDGDGIPDWKDKDDDNDGVPDKKDAFPKNPKEWLDTDKDGIGNNRDKDDDNDGVPDKRDAFPLNPKEWKDTDKDGIGNNRDKDDDNDGHPDTKDAFPLNPKEWLDTDGDGIGNNRDTDDDNDGFSDKEEIAAGSDPLDPFSTPREFTFLKADGSVTTSVSEAACATDSTTNLTWELKTDDDGVRDKDWVFRWGGGGLDPAGGTYPCAGLSACDTKSYVSSVRTLNLCGKNNWRVPDPHEYSGASFERSDPSDPSSPFIAIGGGIIKYHATTNPALDTEVFKDMVFSPDIETAMTSNPFCTSDEDQAVNFLIDSVNIWPFVAHARTVDCHLRLVSGARTTPPAP